MILLDTDIVSHLFYGHEKAVRKSEENAAEGLAISIVTRDEVLRGRADNLLKAANEDELRKAVDRYHRAERLLATFARVDFDAAAIAHFGRLRKLRNLRKIGRADLLIACIALAQGALLATRNVKDFKEVPGLRVENWVD